MLPPWYSLLGAVVIGTLAWQGLWLMLGNRLL